MAEVWQRIQLNLRGISVSVLERVTARTSVAPAAKPPIVLLHGLVAEGETFRKLMRELPDDRRVLALDFPGAGFSERPLNDDVSFAGFADLVHEAGLALGLHQPVILGHSHGGAIALRLAASRPEAVNALILLCPAHPFSHQEDSLIRFYLSLPGRLFARTIPHLPGWLYLFAFKRMPGSRESLGRNDIGPYLHTIRGPGTVPHLLRLLETWKADMIQLGDDLQKTPLEVPTLLLWGDRDIVVPLKTAPPLLQHLAHAEMFTLPGVGHLPSEEQPAECGALIRTWLIWRETHWKYNRSVTARTPPPPTP